MSQPRLRSGVEQLPVWYVATGAAAVLVGAATGGVGLLVLSALRIGCRTAGGDVSPGVQLQCPDGTGKVLPALAWVSVAFTAAATRQTFWGVAAVVCAVLVFVAIPLVTSYVRPASTTVTAVWLVALNLMRVATGSRPD
ncbi:hypothetical protein O7621_20540 [Solwaraspora sp. WMMD937]|uniref:hypothetical protein n=1 Tax=Solwaraspora sp. WMMD937 TaxID=3016090 RepID=UPI00249CB945|nr:hypothetical protein [Solwaraspora sp. WMMD937]WFE20269.1 hypothetical protein O7621_20540 [Solwaraspora sp. WMMD937]